MNPFMSEKEKTSATEIIQRTCEVAKEGMIAKLKEKYDLHTSGRASNGIVYILLEIPKGDQRFEEIKKNCIDLEENISYPEIRIVVKAIDAET